MEYLSNIRNEIRRAEYIPDDGSILWDPFILANIKNRSASYITFIQGGLNDINSEDAINKLKEKFNLTVLIQDNQLDAEKIEPIIVASTSQLINSNLVVYFYTSNKAGYSAAIDKEVKSGFVYVYIASNNESIYKEAIAFLKTYIKPAIPDKGSIKIMSNQGGRMYLTELPDVSSPLLADNYSDNVIDAYNHIISDIKNPNPCGRLSITSGKPGTGKSFLIKSMLQHSDKAVFVLVRPELITHMSDPQFISVLLENKEEGRPYVFVLEDADSCLTTRMSDNMGPIAAVLNMSDGILGSSLDIRIIASTNADRVEFDDALLRPGRLCTHIHVDTLSTSKAHSIFKRLTGKDIEEVKLEIEKDPNLLKRSAKIGFAGQIKGDKANAFTLAEIYKSVYLYKKTIDNTIQNEDK